MDKLGQSALHNYQVIIRQTFYHGCYAMIGEDLNPNPDFWISALYKRLVSTKVLQVKPESKIMGKLRLYSHCGVINTSVVVFGLNMENCTRKILLDMTEESKTLCLFNFTPISANPEGLKNRDIKLNGNALKLHPNGTVPNLLAYSKCGEYNPKETLEVEPYSLFFWLFKDITNLKMCE